MINTENKDKVQELCTDLGTFINSKPECPYLIIAAMEMVLSDMRDVHLNRLIRPGLSGGQ